MARTGDSEPSMEDILASIRRIIVDEVPPLAPEPPVPGAAVASQASEADVLELTEPMADAVPESATAPLPTAQSLSSLIVGGYSGADRTLEALVADLLKPMLRDWLDTHLPDMVERMVSGEVKRISGRE